MLMSRKRAGRPRVKEHISSFLPKTRYLEEMRQVGPVCGNYRVGCVSQADRNPNCVPEVRPSTV